MEKAGHIRVQRCIPLNIITRCLTALHPVGFCRNTILWYGYSIADGIIRYRQTAQTRRT